MDIGRGTPLVCIDPDGCPELTEGALYTCDHAHDPDFLDILEGCSMRVHIVGKAYCFDARMFRPLNDGDTSLVENEIEVKESSLVRA